jgi:hypothetical protein
MDEHGHPEKKKAPRKKSRAVKAPRGKANQAVWFVGPWQLSGPFARSAMITAEEVKRYAVDLHRTGNPDAALNSCGETCAGRENRHGVPAPGRERSWT